MKAIFLLSLTTCILIEGQGLVEARLSDNSRPVTKKRQLQFLENLGEDPTPKLGITYPLQECQGDCDKDAHVRAKKYKEDSRCYW